MKKKYFCINCGKEISGSRYKRCHLCVGKLRTGLKKFTFSKEFLIKEYTEKQKSITQIAKDVGCSVNPVRAQLEIHHIPIRTQSEAIKGKYTGINAWNWQGGVTSKIYYCKEKGCNNKIHYVTACFGGGRCQQCYWNIAKTGKTYANCIDCGKKLSTNTGKRCRSCARKGKLNNNFGKLPKHGNGSYYKQSYMRSSYEIAYAKYCIINHIKYRYEPKYFELKINNKLTTYTPDFYLPETNEYIEIKGWWRDNAKVKFKEFKKQYSNINIKVVDKKILKKEGIL